MGCKGIEGFLGDWQSQQGRWGSEFRQITEPQKGGAASHPEPCIKRLTRCLDDKTYQENAKFQKRIMLKF